MLYSKLNIGRYIYFEYFVVEERMEKFGRRKKPKKRIGIEDWKKIKLVTLNNKVKFEDYFLRTDKEEIFTDKEVPDGCNIR